MLIKTNSKLDKTTGLIKENVMLNEKTIVIGKATNSLIEPDMFVDASVKCKKGQTGLVDKSFITEGEEGQRIAKVRVRAMRIPQIGDKFCEENLFFSISNSSYFIKSTCIKCG